MDKPSKPRIIDDLRRRARCDGHSRGPPDGRLSRGRRICGRRFPSDGCSQPASECGGRRGPGGCEVPVRRIWNRGQSRRQSNAYDAARDNKALAKSGGAIAVDVNFGDGQSLDVQRGHGPSQRAPSPLTIPWPPWSSGAYPPRIWTQTPISSTRSGSWPGGRPRLRLHFSPGYSDTKSSKCLRRQ